nr:MAG TPA: hypothetical protein [Bacteriophage sp.]
MLLFLVVGFFLFPDLQLFRVASLYIYSIYIYCICICYIYLIYYRYI